MNSNWKRLVIKNFDNAASIYDHNAILQKTFACKLAYELSKKMIPKGLWVDLGSGTGLLANELERLCPNQPVTRVDGSKKMLQTHPNDKETMLFDLNKRLPQWDKPPQLIASSFALHWLESPEEKLREWFSALAPEGWLGVVLPVKGCFPEWHNAAKEANVPCTAIEFPCQQSLLKVFKKENIKYQKLCSFSQKGTKITSLLKTLVNVGGHSSLQSALNISEWRKLQDTWTKNNMNQIHTLTWMIQMFIIQK